MIDETLDARGLKCPLPILMAKRALRRLKCGQILEVLATDRGVDADMIDLCEIANAELLRSAFRDGVHRFWLRAGQSARDGVEADQSALSDPLA